MNKIIEKAFLDILVTLVIILSLFAFSLPIRWFLFLYTPVILVARIIALTSSAKVKSGKGVPDWVYHMLYAINVLVLIYQHWLVLAVLWLMIWVLAFVFVTRRRKAGKSTKSSSRKRRKR